MIIGILGSWEGLCNSGNPGERDSPHTGKASITQTFNFSKRCCLSNRRYGYGCGPCLSTCRLWSPWGLLELTTSTSLPLESFCGVSWLAGALSHVRIQTLLLLKHKSSLCDGLPPAPSLGSPLRSTETHQQLEVGRLQIAFPCRHELPARPIVLRGLGLSKSYTFGFNVLEF